jgi:hypothetical protein
MFVFLAKTAGTEPRHQLFNGSAVFAVNVTAQQPGASATIDQSTPGFPPVSLKNVPAGDYYVQALLNIYTEFHRADGHVIWAHMDQWEGQDFTRSPGNLISETRKIHLDPAQGYRINLDLAKKIPAIEMPADTPWVKRIKIESPLLSRYPGFLIFSRHRPAPQGLRRPSRVHYPRCTCKATSVSTPPSVSTKFDPAERGWAREKDRRAPLLEPVGLRPTPLPCALETSKPATSFIKPGAEVPAHDRRHLPAPHAVLRRFYAVNSDNEGPYGDAI